jgi:chromosome segregation ATPase
MEESAWLDKKEIEDLLAKVNDLQSKLDSKSTFGQGRDVDLYQTRASELEAELTKVKDSLAEQKSKSSHQVEALDSMVEALQAKLVNADQSRTALALDKENLSLEVSRMKETNQELHQRLKEQQDAFDRLQLGVDEKIRTFETLRGSDQEEISRLRAQVKSLEQELSMTLDKNEQLVKDIKEKEDMESTVDELSRRNVQSLHAQINKLQKEITKKQMEVSEAESENSKKISNLEEMIESMQLEMDEILAEKEKEIDELKSAVEQKYGRVLLLEKEKEQLVLSMNDMMKKRRDEIDELQTELMEMSTRSANQTREVQTLKLQLEESQYRKEEMDRLRMRVTELGDQLASRSVGSSTRLGDDSTTFLEVENNELRKKLRDAVVDRQVVEDKLREYVSDKGDSSKQVQILRERNAALKNEVEKLTTKMKKLTDKFRPFIVDGHHQSPRNSNNKNTTSTNPFDTLLVDPSTVEATRFVI